MVRARIDYPMLQTPRVGLSPTLLVGEKESRLLSKLHHRVFQLMVGIGEIA